VHFAIQHPAEFHLPSYIPIRSVKVASNFVEGKTYVINIQTSSIRLPANTRTVLDQDDHTSEWGEPITKYSDALRGALGLATRPRPAVIMGGQIDDLMEPMGAGEESQAADFERLVKLLTQALYFSPRIFYRIARFAGQGSDAAPKLEEGRLTLTSGRRYTMSLSHYQYQPPLDGTELAISVPDGINLIGGSQVALSSRYDVIPVELYAGFRDDRTEGLIEIGVVPPALGPTVRIPVVIKPSQAASVVAPLAGIIAGVGAAAGSVLTASQSLKVGLIAGGTAIAGASVMYRRNRRLQ